MSLSSNTSSPTHQTFALLCALLLFSIAFFLLTISELGPIFEKTLHPWDEAVNATVSANTTRTFFPPMIRINPLEDKVSKDWAEGPYWQHIPPLFTYVPWVFFKIDGGVTIEMKRFSYDCMMYVTGLLFIVTVFLFDKSYMALISATLASFIWINLPFSIGLITGTEFGTSDIVLAFSVICSFTALCWYMRRPRQERLEYSFWSIAFIAFVVALPILTKSVLGAIPAVTFFIFLLYDHQKISNHFYWTCGMFVFIILIYYGTLYLSSPQTFLQEIVTPFKHLENYEGHAKPWHAYFSYYIPKKYFVSGLDLPYWGCILAGIYGLCQYRHSYSLRAKQILWLSMIWFVLNLIAISLVTSKLPNFIYQSFLLSIFFSCYSVFLLIKEKRGIIVIFSLLVIILILYGISFISRAHHKRIDPYNYVSDEEKFYHLAEVEKSRGAGIRDIYILDDMKNDKYFKYYIIFLTGAETRKLREVNDAEILKKKYEKVYFIIKDNSYDLLKINIQHKIHQVEDYDVLEFDSKNINNQFLVQMSNIHKENKK